MRPERSFYLCSSCGHAEPKWLGRCPECGEWGGLAQARGLRPVDAARERDGTGAMAPPLEAGVRRLAEIAVSDSERLASGSAEIDRVLGGGIVPGSVVLFGGDPGIGKSTLLLQLAAHLARTSGPVLYATAEESPRQLRLIADRLGIAADDLHVIGESSVEAILESAAALSPVALVLDSIQTVKCEDAGASPGTVSQVREAAARLTVFARQARSAVFLIGHVTKEGTLAGPRALEHLVDTVVYFEGERTGAHRVVRAVKNRFGPCFEVGVFEMTGAGLREVPAASVFFLGERAAGKPGSVVFCAMEGTRPILVEIQALVGRETGGSPRRTTLGYDPNRVALLLAVLERSVESASLDLGRRDVFVNVAGGLSLDETAADLPLALAVAGSALGRAVRGDALAFGEIGLTGEVRAVGRAEERMLEGSRLGFAAAIAPALDLEATPQVAGVRKMPVRSVADAVNRFLTAAES